MKLEGIEILLEKDNLFEKLTIGLQATQVVEKTKIKGQQRRVSRVRWISPKTDLPCPPEEAVLDHFKVDGWQGLNGEFLVPIWLIKSAIIPPENIYTIYDISKLNYLDLADIEGHIVKRARASLSIYPLSKRVFTVTANEARETLQSLLSRRSRKYRAIDPREYITEIPKLLDKIDRNILYDLTLHFCHQAGSRISQSIDAPKTMVGWPDLTIWRDGKVKLVEVKTPADRLREAQVTMSEKVLQPLGMTPMLADITVRTSY